MCLLHMPAGPALASQPVPQPAASCPQAHSCSTNFRAIRGERLSELWPSLLCSGKQIECKCSCRLSGLRQSTAQRPPVLTRQRPVPPCSGSLGEILAGRKQAAEAAGRSKGMHGSSSPMGMLRSTVGVGVLALPTQLPSHQSHITRSCRGTEP